MRIAILTNADQVYVEFPSDVFRRLLKSYLQKCNGNVDIAMNMIEAELKQLTITK